MTPQKTIKIIKRLITKINSYNLIAKQIPKSLIKVYDGYGCYHMYCPLCGAGILFYYDYPTKDEDTKYCPDCG